MELAKTDNHDGNKTNTTSTVYENQPAGIRRASYAQLVKRLLKINNKMNKA